MKRDDSEDPQSQSNDRDRHDSAESSAPAGKGTEGGAGTPIAPDTESPYAHRSGFQDVNEREHTEQTEQESFSPFDDHDSPSPRGSGHRAPRKDSRKRRLISGVVFLLLTFGGLLGVYYALKPSNSVRVTVTTRRDRRSLDATARPDKAPEDVTADAIAEVRSAMSSAPAATPTPDTANSVLPRDAQPLSASSTVLPPDAATLSDMNGVKPEDARTASASRRNQERSIRFPDETVQSSAPGKEAGSNRDGNRPDTSHGNATPAIPISTTRLHAKASGDAPTLPTFGSILPVRTLGKIYTLRSGSSIRLELTRYVAGDGWSLSKGTVLIGQIRSSEQDRAFIAVTGFIDPTQDRLVSLSGDVLCDDGGSGLRGKFHKLSSGWSRAFARVGAAAVNVVGAVAGSRISGQPVIISDIGSQAISPLSSEVDSSLLQQARGFVEVPAGTSGFVMVTRLPASEKGADPKPEARTGRSDVTPSSAATAPLTEEELATLLTSGDPEAIRAALLRMSPQMRRIAETVLAETPGTEAPEQ